jgi:hypothetical protein
MWFILGVIVGLLTGFIFTLASTEISSKWPDNETLNLLK